MAARLPKSLRVRTGQEVLVRPLREGDLPAWCAMIQACSDESLWHRFERRSRKAILAEAPRFCSVNEREFVLVAEMQGRIVGEARLCLIPELGAAEFCVLVADPWQGLGLGSLLTDLTLAWADEQGIRRILVEVVSDNLRILNMLRARGFRFFGSSGQMLWGERHRA
ncbi:MAG: GNAT family N-acetyltransferase [Candidatus Bipolaricaulaceae bacterium]